MADVVRSKTMQDGPRNAVMHFTNDSDGTGEAAVTKVDVSTLSANGDGSPCARVHIDKIHYTTRTKGNGSVLILWDGDVDKTALELPGNMSDTIDYTRIGGLQNTATTGITGDIKFTTVAFGTGGHDGYSVTLEMKKKY